MPVLTVHQGGITRSVPFDTPGLTVHQILENAGILLPHPCGGLGRCGKCALPALSGDVSAPDERETHFGARLSCRARLFGDAEVTLHTGSPMAAETYTASIPADPSATDRLGAAVDIGTTTVALSVYDLRSGRCVATRTCLNPQTAVAADVIGRIDAGRSGRLEELQGMIRGCIVSLAAETGCADRIDRWVITGNTTMLYLFSGRNPSSLAAAPFEADHLFGETVLFEGKPALLPQCMHAFVGADITCAVLTSGICDRARTGLLCDIGTNGEIALWKDGTLYVSSTAAGPVFEGVGIRHGCPGIPGAIDRVSIVNGRTEAHTLEDLPAVGLCGSGVIDAVAAFLNLEEIDETGAMDEDALPLRDGIVLTDRDVRNVQLAKAALAAGIRTLLESAGTSPEDVEDFCIAGGFGSHLELSSAVRIGLIPAEPAARCRVLGNAALAGAAMLLSSSEAMQKARELVSHAVHINLGGSPTFNSHYIDEMLFPEE